ncbi:MAG: hypothetical protein HC853_00695 [Anaerolineae bacterium]|nr:hypothetical protein [Anaerolineae bacterium]
MNINTELLKACQMALAYFELQQACGETLDDAQLDAWDAEMQRMEAHMIPMLRNTIFAPPRAAT